MKTTNNFKLSDVWIFALIIVIATVIYFVPLQSTSFYYDDVRSIERNEVIRHLNLYDIFITFNTRFLVGLSFAVNYIFSGLNPFGYRLTNLLIHCFNAFLVYLLINITLQIFLKQRPKFKCNHQWAAVFASFLFLIHPIQTEPVNFITQRFVLMGTFFYLLTVFLYIQYRTKNKAKYLLLSFIAAIAAMFCKEFVVTLPFMLVLYEFFFIVSKESILKRLKRLLPFFIIILIVPMLLLRTNSEASIVANIADSRTIQEGGASKAVIDITRAHGGVSRFQYFTTELNVICTYIRLLFIPAYQNLDYDYPLAPGLDFKTIICGLFLLSIIVLSIFIYKSNQLLSFSILWFFISLSVESSFIPIGHVIAEYRLYLASVGFVLLITSLFYVRKTDIKIINIIAIIVLIVYSVLTFQRNQIWSNAITLWSDIVFKSPKKARPHNNLALIYDQRGDFKQAIEEYQKAIQIEPNNTELYLNLGIVYHKLKDYAQAIAMCNKAIQIDPNNVDAYFNRATIFYTSGQFDQAVSDYTKAIELNPRKEVYYLNRGNAFNVQGKLMQALEDYNKVVELNSSSAVAYDNLAVTYYQLKQFKDAWINIRKLESLPGNYDPQRIGLIKNLLNQSK